MKRNLIVGAIFLLVAAGVSYGVANAAPSASTGKVVTALASATPAPAATVAPGGSSDINPPIAPAPVPTAVSATFESSPNDVVFKAAAKSGVGIGAWSSSDSNTLVNLGHSVALSFQANGGTSACAGASPVLWGIKAGTNECENALSKTVLYLNKKAVDAGLTPLTYEQNVFLANISLAVYGK